MSQCFMYKCEMIGIIFGSFVMHQIKFHALASHMVFYREHNIPVITAIIQT